MAKFVGLLMTSPGVEPVLSSEHLSVDGTLLRAETSHSSLEQIDESDDKRQHQVVATDLDQPVTWTRSVPREISVTCCSPAMTNRSSSDGEVRLFRKSRGIGAYLTYLSHCPHRDRSDLVVASEVTEADGS